MSSSPEAAIGQARHWERFARRHMIGLAVVIVVGVILTGWPTGSRFGVVLVGLATLGAVVEVVFIASARGRSRRAVDELIDAGVLVWADGAVSALLDARMRELGCERSRRRTAKILRLALADATRPRSSNPLVLAQRSVVLTRGTARALLSDRDMVVRIADALEEHPANPRAVLVLRNLLYRQPSASLSTDQQQRETQQQLQRIAGLLELRTPTANS